MFSWAKTDCFVPGVVKKKSVLPEKKTPRLPLTQTLDNSVQVGKSDFLKIIFCILPGLLRFCRRHTQTEPLPSPCRSGPGPLLKPHLQIPHTGRIHRSRNQTITLPRRHHRPVSQANFSSLRHHNSPLPLTVHRNQSARHRNPSRLRTSLHRTGLSRNPYNTLPDYHITLPCTHPA